MQSDKTLQAQTDGRSVWLDWMRVAACFMVMVVHCTEPFYLGGEGSLILTQGDAFWASLFDSFVRSCVPLFIIASSYLQLPSRYTAGEFFRRRTVRVLVPFVVWTLVYACIWGEPIDNLKSLLLNFNYASGHLWFVYMLVGVYLLIPLLSPWAEKVSKRELEVYLWICLFTTLIPLIRDWMTEGGPAITYGPTGLPRQAPYPLWGECSWNAYGTFYYLSGFVGYVLFGLYLRRFVGKLSWGKTLGIALPCYAVGFAITFGGFLRRVMESAGGTFPVEGKVDMAVWWETTWYNDSIGVALMAIAWVLLFRKVKACGGFYRKVLLPVSKASYGMYLCHLIILVPICGAFREWLGTGTDGCLGFWTTPVEILLASLCSFICVAVISLLLQRIPKVGKYIIG